MDEAYAAADVVVSRAGAIAVSELCIVGKPAILVPFPFAAEDHQTKNAEALVHTQAALMIPDDRVHDELVPEALRLLNDRSLQQTLATNIVKHALPNAANDIAHQVILLGA
jgi:UDP-N-acetylglucosamine--N-acetylmuramyl-(pentapeptide) pyrophosphoryl-undecaprenol N-acetylglucosamine transferase